MWGFGTREWHCNDILSSYHMPGTLLNILYTLSYLTFTLWTWVWVSSGSWWWTGKPGVLQSMGSQRVRYDWATELNWTIKSVQELRETSRGALLKQTRPEVLKMWSLDQQQREIVRYANSQASNVDPLKQEFWGWIPGIFNRFLEPFWFTALL